MRFYIGVFVLLLLLSLLGVVPARAAMDVQNGPVYLPFIGQSARPEQGVSPAIVGGQDADPGAWPWQVFVNIDNTYMCGGSIVHSAWVLTAAHCLVKDDTVPGDYFPPADIMVVAGEHNLRVWEGTEQELGVAEVVVHPSYNPYTGDSDLALLRLSEPVALGGTAGVVPLLTSPEDDALVAPGTLATATGWGTTSTTGPNARILQEVSIPVISNAVCSQALGGITANMICAGYETGGKDTCYGDSGGPLVAPDGADGWKLAGITSFGPRECATNYGAYTRVSRFTEWIGSWVWQAEIAGIAPQSGPAESLVTITGRGFQETTSVQFSGVDAQFTIESDTKIVATVPLTATSGPIRVTTPYDIAVSNEPFRLEYPLAVTANGPGTGYVSSDLGNISCGVGEECSENYIDGTLVRLDAQAGPDSDYVFAGWTGDCGGTTQTCSVLMDASKAITAVFSTLAPTLTVAVSSVDGGAGQVSSTPAGIDCGDACTTGFAASSTVTLAAQPDANSKFASWSGACAGEHAVCQVTMIGAQSVSARFQPKIYSLTVVRTGDGSGRVASTPAGIDCGDRCSSAFETGSTVNLTAGADAGSAFAGWGGACSGTAQTCTVMMGSAQSVTATFEQRSVYLPAMLRQSAATQ